VECDGDVTASTVGERLAYDLLERASDERLRGGSSSFQITQEELAESIGSVREPMRTLMTAAVI